MILMTNPGVPGAGTEAAGREYISPVNEPYIGLWIRLA